MLGKLMKYELRATGRTMLPLFLLTLLLSVFTRMSTAVVQHTHTNITESLNMLLIFAFVLALVGTAVFSVVLMVVRFRNNLMTDEGYLMFTLPVSVHQLLWAKLLVSMLWFVAVFCVDALAILLAIYEDGMLAGLPEFIRSAFENMDRYYAVNGLLYMLEFLGVLLVSMVTACLLFYAPISIGNSFATHRRFFPSCSTLSSRPFCRSLPSSALPSPHARSMMCLCRPLPPALPAPRIFCSCPFWAIASSLAQSCMPSPGSCSVSA